MASEELLNSRDFKKKHPQIGEDIKIMGLREKDKITLTVAVAMISGHTNSVEEYQEAKDMVKDTVTQLAQKYTNRDVRTLVNTGDDPTCQSEKGYYLTVTGTSAEMGDDGSVGRGNRANGLITPNRPMSMEATSGKNPINHVGKIYNLLSNEMANNIVAEVDGVKQVQIMILSQIGSPIDQPKAASAQLILEDNYQIETVRKDVNEVINSCLSEINDITELLIKGKLRTF
jgi:S-adenosylmethionine synthetase